MEMENKFADEAEEIHGQIAKKAEKQEVAKQKLISEVCMLSNIRLIIYFLKTSKLQKSL